jgi:hypothetical protein
MTTVPPNYNGINSPAWEEALKKWHLLDVRRRVRAQVLYDNLGGQVLDDCSGLKLRDAIAQEASEYELSQRFFDPEAQDYNDAIAGAEILANLERK